MARGSANAASIVAVIGSSGSGKSLWIKSTLQARKIPRLLIWDPQGEYSTFGQVFRDRAKLLAHVERAREFAAIYQPGDVLRTYAERFAWFCRLAYVLGDVVVIVEELADVTSPSYAPDAWSVVTRKGRHRGLRVIAASQRPASVDKDFFGNCTVIHCGRVTFERDAKVMAAVLSSSAERVTEARISDLAPLQYIERSMVTGQVREGRVTPPGGRAPA